MKRKRERLFGNALKLLPSLVLIVVVVVIFIIYETRLDRRIVDQNSQYAMDCARQVADHVDDEMDNALKLTESMAYFVENMYGDEEINEGVLASLEKDSQFDAVRYTDINGLNLASDGATSDARDRDYYINGIKGVEGISVIFDSRINNQTLIGFYVPVERDEEPHGVIRGVYMANDYLQNMLAASFFGSEAEVFLCDKNGDIIAGSKLQDDTRSLIEYLSQIESKDIKGLMAVGSALEKGDDRAVVFNKSDVFDNICVVNLSKCDYVLVQVFPKEVTANMIQGMSRSGRIFGLVLLLASLTYYIIMVLWLEHEHVLVKKENQDLGYVMNGVGEIIKWFGLVDFETDTYRYLGANNLGYEKEYQEGEYYIFVRSLLDAIEDPSDEARINYQLSKDNMIKKFDSEKLSMITDSYCVMVNEKLRFFSLMMIPIEKNGDGTSKVLLISQDITEIREIDEKTRKELKEAERKLSNVERNTTEFIKNLADSIKNTDDIAGLADNVRDISLVSAKDLFFKRDEYDLNAVINEIFIEHVNRTDEMGIDYSLNLTKNIPMVCRGDIIYVRRIMKNIISSALESVEKGFIKINVDADYIDNDQVVIHFEVSDSGNRDLSAGDVINKDLKLLAASRVVKFMGGDITLEKGPDNCNRVTALILQNLISVDDIY